jgi:hypothetical protein
MTWTIWKALGVGALSAEAAFCVMFFISLVHNQLPIALIAFYMVCICFLTIPFLAYMDLAR